MDQQNKALRLWSIRFLLSKRTGTGGKKIADRGKAASIIDYPAPQYARGQGNANWTSKRCLVTLTIVLSVIGTKETQNDLRK